MQNGWPLPPIARWAMEKNGKPLQTMQWRLYARATAIHPATPPLSAIAYKVKLYLATTSFAIGEGETILGNFADLVRTGVRVDYDFCDGVQ